MFMPVTVTYLDLDFVLCGLIMDTCFPVRNAFAQPSDDKLSVMLQMQMHALVTRFYFNGHMGQGL